MPYRPAPAPIYLGSTEQAEPSVVEEEAFYPEPAPELDGYNFEPDEVKRPRAKRRRKKRRSKKRRARRKAEREPRRIYTDW